MLKQPMRNVSKSQNWVIFVSPCPVPCGAPDSLSVNITYQVRMQFWRGLESTAAGVLEPGQQEQQLEAGGD